MVKDLDAVLTGSTMTRSFWSVNKTCLTENSFLFGRLDQQQLEFELITHQEGSPRNDARV